jgi:hypothetical protein
VELLRNSAASFSDDPVSQEIVTLIERRTGIRDLPVDHMFEEDHQGTPSVEEIEHHRNHYLDFTRGASLADGHDQHHLNVHKIGTGTCIEKQHLHPSPSLANKYILLGQPPLKTT